MCVGATIGNAPNNGTELEITMNRHTLISASFGTLLGLAASQAIAQETPTIADTDGNGLWSLAELQVAYPDLTQETFVSIDANADAGVDLAELTAALADGAVKAPVAN
jgi:hypothetical protein